MSESDESSKSEHEIYLFKRIHERLIALPKEKEGYKVRTNTALTRSLDKLASSPFASFILRSRYDYHKFSISAEGQEAGTWMNPDVPVLQKHATTIDPSYSNGTEIKANDLRLDLGSHRDAIYIIQQNLTPAMFVGKELQVKLHKLAIYAEGGHSNWHRDSAHSDAHHGTVFLTLNTEYEGGDFVLRHGGAEVSVDTHPTTARSNSHKPRPVVVAFYTGMEYKITPVTKGVQLVLQYDVEVIGEQLPPAPPYEEEPLKEAAMRAQRLPGGRITTYPKPDSTLIQVVINEIQELHKIGTNIVAFPLFHLYRISSVKREYLRGNDSALFDALKDHFDISVNPVLISYDERDMEVQGCVAYRYTRASGMKSRPVEESSSEEESGSEEESDSEDGYTYRHKIGRVIKDASFHLSRASAIEQILQQQFLKEIEYNVEKRDVKRYYGVGIFVKPRAKG